MTTSLTDPEPAAIAALGLAGGRPEKKLLQSLQPETETGSNGNGVG